MSTIARLHYMIDHQATVVCCTPTYALRMAEVAAKEGLDLAASPVRALVVAGEPGGNVPATRHSIQRAWDARVIDHTGMTEIGPWGFECAEAGGGVHVMECEFIAEVVDPETGEAVADGETGELVLTNLGRVGSPLIRYRTGDQVRLTQGRCACGRWFSRADAGILGRIDDMLIIRGNNVFPSAVEDIIRGFDEIAEFRIQVDEQGPMLDLYVLVEATPEAEPSELPSRVAAAIRDRLHFTARVGLVEPGTLPRFEMKAQRVQRLRGSGAAGDG
jgi:phenylacetate-CoA ligase